MISTFSFSFADKLDESDHATEQTVKQTNIIMAKASFRIMISKYGGIDELSEGGELLPQRPHNDFIWAASETGLPAMLLYMAIFIIALYFLLRLLKHESKTDNRLFLLAIFFALLSYVIIANFSFPRERIDISAFIHLLIAITMVMYHRKFPDKEAASRSKAVLAT